MPRNLSAKDYAKFKVINRRGGARQARGLPYFNPRRSVGQRLPTDRIQEAVNETTTPAGRERRAEVEGQQQTVEEEEDDPGEGTSAPAGPESATTTPIKKKRRVEPSAHPTASSLENTANYGSMDVTDSAVEGSGGDDNVAGGAQQSVQPFPMWQTPRNYETVIEFTSVFDFFSWAHSFLWEDVVLDAKKVGKFLTTSFMYLFTNSLCSYMSPAQYDTLPQYARALHVSCDVKFMGAEASFETGATLSGNASINHVIYGGLAMGLNKEFNVLPRKCVYQTNTMVLNSTTVLGIDDYKNMLYGGPPGSAACQSDFPACLSLPRNYPAYMSLVTNYAEPNQGNLYANKDFGCPDLTKFIRKFKADDCKGHTFSWDYEVQCGYIKVPPKVHGIITKGDRYTAYGSAFPGQEFLLGANGKGSIDISDSLLNSGNLDLGRYNQSVEKCGFISNLNHSHHASIPDSFAVGLFPVPNNSMDCANTYVNCKGHWNVTFKMALEIGRDSHTTFKVTQGHNREFFGQSGIYSADNAWNGVINDSNAWLDSIYYKPKYHSIH